MVATPGAAAGIDDMIGLGSFAAVTDDPIAFSDRVIDLLASEDEAGSVGRHGREAIGARCSADVVTAQVRDLYLELIGRTDR